MPVSSNWKNLWPLRTRLHGALHRYHVGPWTSAAGGKTMPFLTKHRAIRAAKVFDLDVAKLKLRTRTGMKPTEDDPLGLTLLPTERTPKCIATNAHT